ncbi:GspE/PulE family protein [Pseudomonas massiliensis]|uniref:GspE/PulE family protein n=1 Tax=Pseudomonas massiliensis TaxID=522492 RepID=UPI00058BF6F7|nr:GspE/PulE family protein [Pseudomonas massiliensis]
MPTLNSTGDSPLDLPTLVEALLRQERIDQRAAELALKGSEANASLHPLERLAALRLEDLRAPGCHLSLDALCAWLAAEVGLPYFRLDPLKLDRQLVTSTMSAAFARHYQILAIASDAQSLTIACAQPGIREWEADLAQVSRKAIRRVLVNPAQLRRLIDDSFQLAQSVRGANDIQCLTYTDDENCVAPAAVEDNAASYEAPVIKIVDWLLRYAFEQGASDIHIEPRRAQGDIRLRVDGMLRDAYQLPVPVTLAVIGRLKSLARMDVAEKRKPQDGRLKTRAPGGATVELRLATLPTALGEKLVMRLFDPAVLARGLSALGLEPEDLLRWQALLARPNGIILVTGPTGSGKTTTLYASLHHLADRAVNLCTIEDPIEMVEPAFNQMQVRPSIGLGFAEGVRALLRQDPDIIMIGEIRDGETAAMAVQAALTGHLVLSTLHTNDACGAVTRLLELGVASYLIRATLLGVMAQRLLRVLCPHCKVQRTIPPTDWQCLAGEALPPKHAATYDAHGCDLCGGCGYHGRAGIYELLVMDEQLASCVSSTPDITQIRRLATRAGMKPLSLAASRLVAKGHTSLGEAMRVALAAP